MAIRLESTDTLCEHCVNADHSKCRRIRRRKGDVPREGVFKLKVCQCPCDGGEPR